MKFYDREAQLQYLKKIVNSPHKELVYIAWRRRIGKTTLVKHALKSKKFAYFFVGKIYKNELLKRFAQQLSQLIDLPLQIDSFYDFFKMLFKFSHQFDAIVFDEFQNFLRVDKSIYSYIQQLFDETDQPIKLILTGSHYTILKEIFEKYTNPLYGRKTGQIFLKPFDFTTQLQILKDHSTAPVKPIDFLTFYGIYWWIPYYQAFLADRILPHIKTNLKNHLIKAFFDSENIFLTEGKDILLIEFGDKHPTYFAILAAIAAWNHTRWEIASYIGMNPDSLGVYLHDLVDFFDLLEQQRSIMSSPNSKKVRYIIKDGFLKFWFRYVYRYQHLIELNQLQDLIKFVQKDINTFLGYKFEDLIKEYLIKYNGNNPLCPFKFTQIWTYFDGKREIDLVCLEPKQRLAGFLELKLTYYKNKSQLLQQLQTKANEISKFKNFKKHFATLNLREFWKIINLS